MKTSGNARSSTNGTSSGSQPANGKRRGSEPAVNSNSNKNDASSNASNGTPNSVTNGNGHANGSENGNGHQNGSGEPSLAISNKIKSEALSADREAFLSAFEKPTQIYRYMRTRMLHSPVYLARTLSYMKERMSRTHAGRKTFKVDSILSRVIEKAAAEEKERNSNDGLGKSANQPNFYNIICLGFSDPTHNWGPGAKAKVEMKIARICVKKRKEANVPIKKAFEGSCVVDLLPTSSSTEAKASNGCIQSTSTTSRNTSKCPVLSIPSESINLVNGHVVRSYVMVVKVSLYQSYLAKPVFNGSIVKQESSPDSVVSLATSAPQLSRKLASVSIKRLSLSNNSTLLNSHNNRNSPGNASSSSKSSRASSETDFQRMNPKVVAVKPEDPDAGSDDDECDRQPKLKRRRSIPAARDTQQFIYPGVGGCSNTLGCRDTSDDQISFLGQITIYDKQSNMQLTNADYDMLLCKSQKKRPLLSFSNLTKQEAAWEILDPSHPKVQAFTENGTTERPILKLALRISPFNLEPYVDPPAPLSSASGKHKGKSNKNGDDDETEQETTKVIYQFQYNNNSRQQTESRNDLRCPWCALNCFKLYSLLKHLKLCHTRFNFAYVPVPNGARIDVSINESFDGSYTGSAYDLVTQPPGEAFARNGPTKRTNVFSMLVLRPPKIKQTLQEFLESEENDADQRRTYMTGHNRLYYHTTTCLPIHPKEIDVDSEGEPDPEWLQLKTSAMIDEFTDVNEGEKEVMKMWNLHVLKHNYVGDCQIPLACEMFVEFQGKELIRRNLYRNFILHLTSLFDFGLLSPEGMYNIVRKLQAQMKDNNTAGSLRESWKAHNTPANTGPNFSHIKFDPPSRSSSR